MGQEVLKVVKVLHLSQLYTHMAERWVIWTAGQDSNLQNTSTELTDDRSKTNNRNTANKVKTTIYLRFKGYQPQMMCIHLEKQNDGI